MRIRIFCLIFGICLAYQGMAQQEVMFTQYMFNGLALNPAYAGSHESVSLTLLARDQWSGIDGAPNTQTFSIHSPINKKNIGLGLQVIRDKISVFNQIGVNASYAYRIPTEKGKLSLGLQAGFTSYQADFTQLSTDQGGSQVFGANVSKFLPNFGAGVYYYSKKYYLGFSIPQLISNGLNESVVGVDSDARQRRHYFLTGGYVFELNRNVKFKPNLLLKAVAGAPIELDVNGSFLFNDVLWLGLSWRSFADIDALLEVQLTPELLLGYSYDFANTTDLRRVNSGSHELMLNYRLRYTRRTMLSPRYF
ncbi:MAG: PorP/SprF family type IX secretion system membrane protein [Cyclobacteriaceae bacterium]